MNHMRTARRTLGALACGGLGLLVGAPAAIAAAEPTTSVRETVQVVMDADAKVSAKRLYTQIVSTGNGSVQVKVPSPDGLRDLNGFSAPSVKDGVASYSMNVNGKSQKRTVADFNKNLPVK